MPYSPDLKALHVLRENVRALLSARKESEAWLATCLGFKHRSSLNKFLNRERTGFHMWRLDRLASFFGVPVYQLFQPGIAPNTERRVSERRSRVERRIGHSHRMLGMLRAEVDSAHPRTERGRDVPTPTQVAAKRLTDDYERRLFALFSQAEPGRQTASARKARARVPESDRASG